MGQEETQARLANRTLCSTIKRDQEIPQMTKTHSMNHYSCHFEIAVPSVSQRVEQMTHIAVEARQNQMTHKCSWTSDSHWEQEATCHYRLGAAGSRFWRSVLLTI